MIVARENALEERRLIGTQTNDKTSGGKRRQTSECLELVHVRKKGGKRVGGTREKQMAARQPADTACGLCH